MRDYEELVRELREADEKSMCGECGMNLHSGTTKKGVLFAEAADAIEELVSNADKFKWIKIESRPMTEEERKEWSEHIGYDIEYEDAIIYTSELPDDGQEVLVCNDDGHMMIAKHESEVYEWYYKYTNYDFDVWDNEEQGPVLWWCPLPEPPKEADNA